jgi:hypothetical protein
MSLTRMTAELETALEALARMQSPSPAALLRQRDYWYEGNCVANVVKAYLKSKEK